ncbi:SGNH/GDSL hydrolase family protein [Nocardioides sp. TRM66260-LWL]|uniref:SGNH/GDSL hydrolase family protein n=1 Tax=Nocardioides sp. TRM66260-LWL TaxID=2874478 RepID=UPI001CC6D8EB|nr:SGNH/GDSL hydrolase family protein [Nocardioides sp. TRM66260-LWL]MBZ5735703.1 SGNH/GDSL hydrolase family protein [Nocardioides sp. TRM66260-LWL]
MAPLPSGPALGAARPAARRTSRRRALALALATALLAPVLASCSSAPTDARASAERYPGAEGVLSGTGERPARLRVPASYARYVALGDSFTAAPGVPTTDASTGCLRSSSNYPRQLAERLGSTLVDVSCSGADTTDLADRQRTFSGRLADPQLDALGDSTDLVTVGLGGNDELLFTILFSGCVSKARTDPTGSPCADLGADKADAIIEKIGNRLATGLRQVRQRAPRAMVVAVGYPELLADEGTCRDRLPLATGDFAFVHQVNVDLNQAIRAAARRAGVLYADVARFTRGHGICAGDPWINDIRDAPGRAIPLHPFAEEQAAVVRALLAVLPKNSST